MRAQGLGVGADITKLSDRVAAAEAFLGSFVATELEQFDKGVWVDMIRVSCADARMRSHSVQTLPNNAASLRAVLTLGAPIITGYQVDGRIHEFHRDAKACEALGFLLPRFDASIGSISGHAVLILGYDVRAQAFIARNSWGRAWGVDGHFLVPFAAVEDPEAFTYM